MPFAPGRPGHFVRLSSDAPAACVSNSRDATAADAVKSRLERNFVRTR
jgi:hypothetical protein